MASVTRTLEERLESFAEPWSPQAKGDKLVGTIVDVDLRDSDYGDPYPIVTVARDDGSEVAWHAFHTVARRELAKRKPQVGDRIGVAYFGKAEPKKPGMSGAELYKVIVEQVEPQPVDWDSVAGDEPDDEDETPAAGDGQQEEADGDLPF